MKIVHLVQGDPRKAERLGVYSGATKRDNFLACLYRSYDQ